ncbi:MAG: alpha/beta hydrolase [Ornithinimicrobium sp.]
MAFPLAHPGGRLPTLTARNATLDYDVSGAGPTIIALHGLTSSRARDAGLGLDLSCRASENRVIRYDARGHGASSGDDDARSYTWSALALDLLALMDAVAPWEAVHGVGQSMGSATLLHAALDRPDRFASLVLGIPPTAWGSRVVQRRVYRSNADLVERSGLTTLLADDEGAGRPPASTSTATLPPTVAEALMPTVFRGAALADLPPPEELTTITAPTLILAWVGDPAHPLSTAQRLHDLLPHSQLVVAHTPADVETWPDLVAQHCQQARGALEK